MNMSKNVSTDTILNIMQKAIESGQGFILLDSKELKDFKPCIIGKKGAGHKFIGGKRIY